MTVKVDLHTHSIASPDGGLTKKNYIRALMNLDLIAVTDHNETAFALGLARELKGKIIVGEEIMTTDGELIGLYLTKKIEPGMSARQTADAIKEQAGIVIVPHPVDKHRKGLSLETMEAIADTIDAVEIYNGRSIGAEEARSSIDEWAKKRHCPLIASSDAHSASGIGRTYTTLEALPTSADEMRVLLTTLSVTYTKPPVSAFLAPKLNRFRRKFRR